MSDRYERDKELWADDSAPALSPRQRTPREPGAPTQKEQAATKRAAKVETGRKQTNAKVRRRQRWEKSPEGQERMKDVVDYATEEHNKVARERPELGLKEQGRLNITHQQAYEHYGFKNADAGPGHRDTPLPGMEDPHSLPRPRRWEEYSPEEQAHVAARVKNKTGATMDSMARAYGAQVDQAFLRSRKHGADAPYGQDFYTEGEPAKVLRATAKRQNVPLGLVAAVNADTSPQMKFSAKGPNGTTRYPNAEQAEHAIAHVKEGGDASDITKEGLTGHAATGFHKNLVKAARRATQVIRHGATVSETYDHASGGTGFGPKTAAYHNSWLKGTPDYLVSDVHTGGGGHLPHLSSDKPVVHKEGEPQFWDSGAPKREKSEREKGIETRPTGSFHAMADYAARQAQSARGLHSIRQTQAAQWGEERIRRGETAGTAQVGGQFPKAEEAYPKISPRQFHDPKQGKLF